MLSGMMISDLEGRKVRTSAFVRRRKRGRSMAWISRTRCSSSCSYCSSISSAWNWVGSRNLEVSRCDG